MATAALAKSVEETDKGRAEEEAARCSHSVGCIPPSGSSPGKWLKRLVGGGGFDCSYDGHECSYMFGLNSQPTPTTRGSP